MAKTIETIVELMEFLENNYKSYGFRGLSGIQGKKEYEENEYLDFSIDDWDGRDIKFNSDLPLLNGTCAISVCGQLMYDDEVLKCLTTAFDYTDCNKVALICGTESEQGTDDGERILSTDERDPATFICYVSKNIIKEVA